MPYGPQDDKANTRFDQNSKDTLRRKISYILSWHRKNVAFPLNSEQVEEVVADILGVEARAHMLALLTSQPHVLNMVSAVAFYVPDGSASHKIVRVPHTSAGHTETPYPQFSWRHKPPMISASTPHAPELISWLREAQAVDKRIDRAESIVACVIARLGTYGQVLRLWPGVVEWLPDGTKSNACRNQARRSSLPETFTFVHNRETHTVKQWEMKELLGDIDTLLATGLIIRETSNASKSEGYRPDTWYGS